MGKNIITSPLKPPASPKSVDKASMGKGTSSNTIGGHKIVLTVPKPGKS